MLHIVFQQDDVQLLKEAIKLDETLQGEVFEIKDEWGVGPLKDLDTDEGWTARQNWWREMLVGSPYGEKLDSSSIDYFEFGVSGGHSFKWWLDHNKNSDSKFYGFDTFEGLPEAFGPFGKGSMAVAIESLHINDPRASFYKGLFQDTLIPFLEQYKGEKKKLIHLDADLFSATLFSLSQLYRFLNDGDILLFDEFAVPKHEFMAFKIFTESFYVNYEVIGAANNYLFLAVKIKK